MNRNRFKLVLWTVFFIAVMRADLYGATFDLGEVLVSATKTESYQQEVGASTTVITQDDLARLGYKTVYKVLETIPGVSITPSGPFGGAASVDIRGAKRGQTLVMIDGVEVYDPIGVSKDFDFANLLVENIERIEVVRGPQSTLYGSDAMAGVINIITKKGKGRLKSSAVLEAGSHNTFYESIGVSGSEGKINFSVSAARIDTDGISKARDGKDNDGYSNTMFSSRIGVDLTQDSELFASIRYSNAEIDVDDGAYQDDPNRINNSMQFSGIIGFAQELNENWDHLLTFSGVSFDRSDSDPADSIDTTENEYSRFRGDRKKIEWQHNIALSDRIMETIGYEYEEERGASYSTGTNWWSNSQSDRRRLQNRAVYLQSQMELKENLFTSTGFRVDTHDIFGSEITYKLSSSYAMPQIKTRLKANYGTAFRAPNLYQLYDGTYGNPKLEPEKSRGFDLGVEHRCVNDTLFLSATYFYNKYKNLIDSDPATWVYVNIKNGKARGYELESVFDVMEALKVGGNYTYTKTRDGDTAKEFGRRPKHQASVFVDWNYSRKGNIYLNARYVGSRMDSPAYNDYKNKKYFITDISSSYDLNETIQLFGRVDNIFDVAYEPVRGYNGVDRSVYLGVKGSF